MDVEKVSFNVDTLYARLEEQVPIESAIPLPQGRVELLFWGEQYAENRIGYTDDLLAGPGTQPGRGILIYAPDRSENLFTVGKRFGIPQSRLKELNGTLSEPFTGAERILIIK